MWSQPSTSAGLWKLTLLKSSSSILQTSITRSIGLKTSMDLTSNLLPFWNKSASFAHKKPVWELLESAVENGQEVTRGWGVNWKNKYVSWILFCWSWASDSVMSANRKPRTKYVRGQNERLFQPHPMGVFEIILYSLYISKVFFFPPDAYMRKSQSVPETVHQSVIIYCNVRSPVPLRPCR